MGSALRVLAPNLPQPFHIYRLELAKPLAPGVDRHIEVGSGQLFATAGPSAAGINGRDTSRHLPLEHDTNTNSLEGAI